MKILPIQPNFHVTSTLKKETQKDKATEKLVDTYTPAQQEEKNITYEKPAYTIDVKTIERIKLEADSHYQSLRQLVLELLERQGISAKLALSGEVTIEVDEETRLKSQEAIAEGGPLSPENVSDRIVNFAIAISGGDKSKPALLKHAIDEGFQAAKEALGGQLPDISHRTYDLVMEKLDAWANGDKNNEVKRHSLYERSY